MFDAPQGLRHPRRDVRIPLGVGEGAGKQAYRLGQSADLLLELRYPFVCAGQGVRWGKQLPTHCLALPSREAPP